MTAVETGRFQPDIEHPASLPASWVGLDPTAIVDSVLSTRVDLP